MFGPSDFDDFDTQIQSDEHIPEEFDAAFSPDDFLPYDEEDYDRDLILAQQELEDFEGIPFERDDADYYWDMGGES